MACYNPLTAYRCSNGAVVFDERARHDSVATLSLPCGQCIGCRLERSRQWAVRCMHEAQMHTFNCFVTLTYSNESLVVKPFFCERCERVVEVGSLHYCDFQLFMKRLRERFSRVRIRFYMCGEYGEQFGRPHFHVCLFGVDFPDKVYLSKTASGCKVYRSAILESLWTYGFSSVGAVTFESAAYVARYVMKKVTGNPSEEHYRVVNVDSGEYSSRVPEFNHMSLRPGIGASWLKKFQSDVYPHGKVVVNGVECHSPRYYDKLFAALAPDSMELLQFARQVEGRARYADNTPERLLVKEQVTRARVGKLPRKIT